MLVATIAPPAHADGLQFLANWDIRAMASSPTNDGGVVRAIAAVGDQGTVLILETFAGANLRNPAFQAWVTTLWIDGQAWNLNQSTSSFANLAFANDGGLDFTARGAAGEFSCHVNLPAQGTELGANCTLRGAPQPVPVPAPAPEPCPQPAPEPYPQPYPQPLPQPQPLPPLGGYPGGGHHHHPRPPRVSVNWAAQPEVIRACGEAFYGQANESACLDTAMTFRIDPTNIIRTCDQITFGDDHALSCLRAVAGAWFDPTPAMTACDAATFGDDNFLRCAQSIAGYNYAQAGVVAACDAATFGDDHALACIDIARGASGDVSALIKTCDDATFGDDAALACLQRAIRR